jgi:aspartyl-tRNA(Asn)/glutamyl-tRNA(Gln) amidotransferase subunit C
MREHDTTARKWPNAVRGTPIVLVDAIAGFMKLDRARVDHLARLASLSLDDAEAAKMAEEIDAILRYVDELASLDDDAEGVAPMANVQLLPVGSPEASGPAWRADAVEPGLSHDEALAGAPRTAEGGFAVPAFVEGAA